MKHSEWILREELVNTCIPDARYGSLVAPAYSRIGGIRETYHGRLVMVADLTVINVTPDHIEVRQASPDPAGWLRRASEEFNAAPCSKRQRGSMSDWLKKGIRR